LKCRYERGDCNSDEVGDGVEEDIKYKKNDER